MAVPTTREEFAEYCLRRLGKPVIDINVADEQVDDRIDDALKYFYDYHFDGTSKVYLKHEVTAVDKQRGYVPIAEGINGVSRIFQITGLGPGNYMFDIKYQIALNDLYTLTSHSITPYFMTMQHLQFLETILQGEKPIRFNRHQNRLYIDMKWDKVEEGSYLIVEAFQNVDPEDFDTVWNDRWLLQYGTALIKRQWGENLKKFGNMQMPGGVVFNGQQIYNEAVEEIAELEEKMINDFSTPLGFEIG